MIFSLGVEGSQNAAPEAPSLTGLEWTRLESTPPHAELEDVKCTVKN